jgi:hypothetical protein
MSLKHFVGRVYRVPHSVSETGYVIIAAADGQGNPMSREAFNYEMLAAEYNEEKGVTVGKDWFKVTEKEVLTWEEV